MRIAGCDLARDDEDALLRTVGLAAAARRRVEDFSKGMRQRLGIAIALAKDPPAFIMDEPTSGLDPLGAAELGRLVLGLRDQGKAVLLVTHDVFRIEELATRAVIIRDGRSQAVDVRTPPKELDALYHAPGAGLGA